jgi:GDP/UDP-N,N'-diacetylbacillosamine 2-epimerase (hydrolysing)
VIDCEPEEDQIRDALVKLYSHDFKASLAMTSNPYGEGGASIKVVKVLRDAPLVGIIQKTFHDL